MNAALATVDATAAVRAENKDEYVDLSVDERLGNRELAHEITRLAGHINAANCRLLRLIARFDRQEGWCGEGLASCAHWLSWKCGIGLHAAREKVRTARALDGLPRISEAFAQGQLSYSMVRAITRTACPATEAMYLGIAQNGTVSQVEHVVRKHGFVEKVQAEGFAAFQQEARELLVHEDDQGCMVFRAKLPPEQGELLMKALDALLDRDEDERAACGVLPGQEDANGKPVRTYAQKRADALVQLAEHYIATEGEGGAASLKGSERCQVMLHVDVETLQEGSEARNCGVGERRWLAPSVARRLSCDASLVAVLKDGEDDKVLNIGRRARIVPPQIARAVDVRDGSQCRFPGCACKRYTDRHHIRHWADGGETSAANLVTLCRFHHRALHDGDFTVDSSFVFRNREGQVLYPDLRPSWDAAAYDAPDMERLSIERYGENVTAGTCVTGWNGEALDVHWAVELLLYDKERAEAARLAPAND